MVVLAALAYEPVPLAQQLAHGLGLERRPVARGRRELRPKPIELGKGGVRVHRPELASQRKRQLVERGCAPRGQS